MIEKRDILEYLSTKNLNEKLRGYTYIIDVLYHTGIIGDTGMSYNKALEEAIRTVANDYGVKESAINTSIRLVFREADIKQTVKNNLRGMYYELNKVINSNNSRH